MPKRKRQRGKSAETDEHGLRRALQPRLRLFLSVDLVGSTAFKQANAPEILAKHGTSELPALGPTWFKEILGFYREFEEMLHVEWQSYNANCANLQLPEVQEPEFWKSNGDELLYTFELRKPREAAGATMLWLSALENYRKRLRLLTPQLDVKSTGWTAGFPVMNTEVIFRKDIAKIQTGEPDDALVLQFQLREQWYAEDVGRHSLTRDYIGPSIDTGFRLGTWATPRKFIVSVELALLLSGVTLEPELDKKYPIFFEGTDSLKGVVGGRPYPIIWIAVDGHGPLLDLENRLIGREALHKDELKAYCLAYIRENSEFLMRPFIRGSTDEMFSVIPTGYFEHLRQYQETLTKEQTKNSSLGESLGPSSDSNGDAVDEADVEKFVESLPHRPADGETSDST